MSVAINEVLTLSPKGRASREAYWASLFVSLVLTAILLVLLGLVPNTLAGTAGGAPAWLAQAASSLILAYAAALALFLTTAVVRRLHDIGYAGPAALFLVIPGVQLIVLVILGLVPGKKGLNRFGPDPLAVMTIGDAAPAARGVPAAKQGAPVRPVRVIRETTRTAEAPLEPTRAESPTAQAAHTALSEAGPAAPTDVQGEAVPSPDTAEGLYQIARYKMAGEPLSTRLQLRVRYELKLRDLLKKGKISQADYDLWARRLNRLS